MRSVTRAASTMAAAVGLAVASVPGALGSGYHPDFDQAVAEAQIIVAGRVTKAWNPKPRAGANSQWHMSGDVYRMAVTNVYKGSVKAGDDIVFWDPYSTSTAGYFAAEGKQNLTFLVPNPPDAEQLRTYDFGAQIRYSPISNCTKDAERTEEYDGWVYLLNMVVRGSPANDVATYRTILPAQRNRYVLHYVLGHWPKEMTDDDEALFRGVLKKHRDDPYITTPILELLSETGRGFATEELVDLLKTSDELSRDDLLPFVNSANIAACREIIFGWVSQDWAWEESTKVLARLAPDYLKDQLRKRTLPFWVLIPCLQELHINGSAVGKRDYPATALNCNPYTLRAIGDVVRGEEFQAVVAMGDRGFNSDWRDAFPLLDDVLAGPDCQARRLVVAVMRTFGEDVRRAGKGYRRTQGGAKGGSPVRIELVAPKGSVKLGSPIRVTVKEVGLVDGAWISFRGEMEESVESSECWTTSGSGFWIWADTRLPKRHFARLKKGSAHTSAIDIGSLVSKPGVYKVSVTKFYPHDGVSVGLDAWTGAVSSKPVQVTVTR